MKMTITNRRDGTLGDLKWPLLRASSLFIKLSESWTKSCTTALLFRLCHFYWVSQSLIALWFLFSCWCFIRVYTCVGKVQRYQKMPVCTYGCLPLRCYKASSTVHALVRRTTHTMSIASLCSPLSTTLPKVMRSSWGFTILHLKMCSHTY